MATGYRNAAGVDMDDVFDPYVEGTKPAATSYRTSDGVDLNQRYAPLSAGSAAPAQGYRIASGADFNTLWAKKGTASYGLPINGSTFTATPTAAGSSSSATLRFITNSSTFAVSDPNRLPTTLASGSIPAAATKCRVTLTRISGTTAMALINPLSSFTTLSGSNATVEIGNIVDESGQPAINSSYNVKIEYQNSGGTVISTTNCTFRVNTNPT